MRIDGSGVKSHRSRMRSMRKGEGGGGYKMSIRLVTKVDAHLLSFGTDGMAGTLHRSANRDHHRVGYCCCSGGGSCNGGGVLGASGIVGNLGLGEARTQCRFSHFKLVMPNHGGLECLCMCGVVCVGLVLRAQCGLMYTSVV